MTAATAFRRALIYGLVVDVVVAVVGSIIGGVTVGADGVASALVAAGIGVVLTVLTGASMLIGARMVQNDPGNPLYFAVVLGGWLVKFAVFIVAVLVLRDQPFVHPVVIFVCLVAVVVGGVVADSIAVLRSRVPYVALRSSGTPPVQ